MTARFTSATLQILNYVCGNCHTNEENRHKKRGNSIRGWRTQKLPRTISREILGTVEVLIEKA